jgi:hypothetical protein
MPPADNSRHLTAAAHQRHLDCTARVIAAIAASKREGTNMTVTTIARRAKVSRTFLHDPAQADLLQRIRELAANPAPAKPAAPAAQPMTARSQDTVIRALREANNKLRQENAQLRDELARALGDLRDVRRSTASLTSAGG